MKKYSNPRVPRPRRVLVCCEPRTADYLRGELQAVAEAQNIKDIEFVAVHSLQEFRQQVTKVSFDLVLMDADLPPTDATTLVRGDNAAVREAFIWVEKDLNNRQAIILTGPWESLLNYKFFARVTGIEKSKACSCPALLFDMIMAGLQNVPFLQPTVIDLEFSKEGDEAVLRHTKVEGPIGVIVGDMLADLQEVKIRTFEDITTDYRKAFASPTLANFVESGRRLWDLLKPCFERLAAVINKLPAICCEKEAISSLAPLHLHITCEAAMLALPLDLALETGTANYFGRMLPVVWKIRFPKSSTSIVHEDHTRVNATSYQKIKVVHSCTSELLHESLRFKALRGTLKEAYKLYRILQLPARPPNVKSKKAFIKVITDDRSCYGRMLHVASHGVLGLPADKACVLIGPDRNNQAQPVTAEDIMISYRDEKEVPPPAGWPAIGFIFANCCELAQQVSGREAACSHHGSFVESLMERGLCREAIANRWEVNDKQACIIAHEFYRARPHTVYGRSVALLRACKMASQQIGGVSSGDSTWLAPTHFWREN